MRCSGLSGEHREGRQRNDMQGRVHDDVAIVGASVIGGLSYGTFLDGGVQCIHQVSDPRPAGDEEEMPRPATGVADSESWAVPSIKTMSVNAKAMYLPVSDPPA